MHASHNTPTFFATDLTNFLACRHLMALERLAAHGLAKRPFFDDPMLEILRERGLEHERAYIQSLAQSGRRIVERMKCTGSLFGAAKTLAKHPFHPMLDPLPIGL